jgi:hypothetical protein
MSLRFLVHFLHVAPARCGFVNLPVREGWITTRKLWEMLPRTNQRAVLATRRTRLNEQGSAGSVGARQHRELVA